MFFMQFSLMLYFTGLVNCVFIYKKNFLVFLVSAEFMFLGLNLLFIGFGFIFNLIDSVVISFMLFMMTVGESAVGLGLSMLCLKLKNSVKLSSFSELKF